MTSLESLPPVDVARTMQQLVARRDEFLAFLERRLRDRAAAEDVLQDAYIKAQRSLHALSRSEAYGAWFYQLLRTTSIDHERKRAARGRLATKLGAEHEAGGARASAVPTDASGARMLGDDAPCACVSAAVDDIKPEYADALRRITVDEVPVREYAAGLGITAGNAAVRAFRAREALRRSVVKRCGACAADGCTRCSCEPAEPAP